jgi:gluconate kinase
MSGRRGWWLAPPSSAPTARCWRMASAVILCSSTSRQAVCLPQSSRAALTLLRQGSPEVIGARLAQRSNHFMPASLLRSQFEALEEPDPATEPAVTVDVTDLPGARQCGDFGWRWR